MEGLDKSLDELIKERQAAKKANAPAKKAVRKPQKKPVVRENARRFEHYRPRAIPSNS